MLRAQGWAAQPVAVQRGVVQRGAVPLEAAPLGEPPVVARRNQVEECLARADQCQDPAESHPCLGNLRPDRECQAKRVPQRILPEYRDPAWAPALPKGLAFLGHRRDRAATDFPLSYRTRANYRQDKTLRHQVG